MQRIFCVLVVLISPLLLIAGDDDARKELKALEGKWKTVGLEAGGKPLPKEAVIDFTFIVGAVIGFFAGGIGGGAAGAYVGACNVIDTAVGQHTMTQDQANALIKSVAADLPNGNTRALGSF